NYLVETSAMKRRSIQLRHPATSTRIRSGIAFLSVCVLVGLVAFFAGAHAQVATPTPSPAATPTPAPPTPFPPFAPLRSPRPCGGWASQKKASPPGCSVELSADRYPVNPAVSEQSCTLYDSRRFVIECRYSDREMSQLWEANLWRWHPR